VPWLAQWACIDFGSGEGCAENVLINFKNIEKMKFRHEFLKQFLPWLLAKDFVLSMEIIGKEVGKWVNIK